MKKEFGVFLFLGLLVLSMSFSSAGWFSDTWNNIIGEKTITGNVVNSYGFDSSEQYCPGTSTCRYRIPSSGAVSYRTTNRNCGTKADILSKVQSSLSNISSADVVSIGCRTMADSDKSPYIVDCESGDYNYCVKTDNDGYGNSLVLGVKYGVPTCTSFSYSGWSTCVNGKQTRTTISSSPSGCSGGSPVLSQDCTVSIDPVDPVDPVVVNCTDSDGGLNYYVKGNFVNSQGSGSDACLDSKNLVEGYCGSCQYGLCFSNYTCPNGCVDGRCFYPGYSINFSKKSYLSGEVVNFRIAPVNLSIFKSTEVNLYIIKPSGYFVNFWGKLNLSGVYPTSFNMSDLADIFNETGNYTLLACDPRSDCESRNKLNTDANSFFADAARSFCVDSDGGLNYYEKGNVSNFRGQRFDSCILPNENSRVAEVSSCFGSECKISEGICTPTNNMAFRYYSCPNGCVDGACVNKTIFKSCSDVTSFVANPSNLTIDGREWILEYNNTYNNSRYLQSYASWRYNINNQYAHANVNTMELSDKDAVKESLESALEYQLCDKQNIYLDNSEIYETVYVCKNIWRLANDAQKISSNNNWNYQNDVIVMWFNGSKLFNMEFSMNDYYGCYDFESCQRMDMESHKKQQSDLIRFMESLINNKEKYVNPYMDYISQSFVKFFLGGCSSEVSDEGYLGSWQCKQEPAICPPHGEQKQICTRYSSELKKDEVRETTIQCSPGVCSGCYVPRWFGSVGNNNCIEYGFRFKQNTGDFELINENRSFVYKGSVENNSDSLSVSNTLNRSEYPSIVIYNNNTMSFKYEGWDNKTYVFKKGDQLDLLSLAGTPDYYVQLLFKIDSIYFDYTNYENSYFNYSFLLETSDRVYNYSDSRMVPVYLSLYCDIDGQVKQQKTEAWGDCQNNYECESNLCSYGECVDLKGIANELNGFKGFLTKMLCKLSNLFNSEDYAQCLVSNS